MSAISMTKTSSKTQTPRQVAALGVLNHSTQYCANSGIASMNKLQINKYIRMPYRRLVPKTVYINTLRTGDADLRFYVTIVQDG